MQSGFGNRPAYHTEDFISKQIQTHCKEAGIKVNPVEAQKVIDYLGNDPHYVYGATFNGNHALISLIKGLQGVHLSEALKTAAALGITLVTNRRRCLTLWEGHVTVLCDDNGCIEDIIEYG